MSQPNVWIIDHRDSFTWNLAELVRMTGMAVPRVVSNESPELEQAVQAGKSLSCLPVRERWRMPATGPPSVFWTACPALPRCWAYAWGIRSWACASEPVWNTFPAPFTERGKSYAGRSSVPPGRIAGAISCRALPFLAPCRFSLAGGADCHGEGFREKRAGHPPQAPPLYGIQFHPESILTPDGEALLRNFLSLPAGSREKRRIK